MKNNIRHEKSCGAVVFTMVGDTLKYLLVHSVNGFWGFPKGHVEAGESEYDTAKREIKEETGVDVTFIDGFRATDEHPITRHGKLFSKKQVVYFLASYSDQTPGTQDSEIVEVRLMDYKMALSLLQHGSLKDILTKANDFLGGTK